jgi:hypothetical protein
MRPLSLPSLRATLLAGALVLPAALPAKIDLVTLPGRDTTQLSIYKSEDLTLVRETRSLTFTKGSNDIQFSWANTLIDPTSVELRVLTNADSFTVLDTRYPANTQNTVVWTVEAAQDGDARVEITCFASGISWEAEYKAFANADETELRLEPYFKISNNSGADFENANTRLVVGEVNLVEAIAELARRGMIPESETRDVRRQVVGRAMKQELFEADAMFAAAPSAAMMDSAMLAEAKAIIKQAVSEYYLYSIEGTETLNTGWAKQLPNPAFEGIPIEMRYEYDPRRWGATVTKLYTFKNDTEHKMGETPMPEGMFYIFGDDGRGGTNFKGNVSHKYVPVGEDYEINLGDDGRLLLEARTMSLQRENVEYDRSGDPIGWDERRVVEIEARNSLERAVPVKIVRQFGGDWTIEKPSDEFKKLDRETVEWMVEAPALGKKVIRFTLVERKGSRSKNN